MSLSEKEVLIGYLSVPTFDFDYLIALIRGAIVDRAKTKHKYFKSLLLGTFSISNNGSYTYEVIKRYDLLVFRKRNQGFYIELFFEIGFGENFNDRNNIIKIFPQTETVVVKNNLIKTDIWYHVLPDVNIVLEKDGSRKYFATIFLGNYAQDSVPRHERDLSSIIYSVDDDANTFIIKNYDIFKYFHFLSYDFAKAIYRV